MSQRAALYTIGVRRRSKRQLVRLGDLDGAGTSLVAVLERYLGDFAASNREGTRIVRSLSTAVDGDDLFAVVQHGQNGVAADIVDPSGDVRLRQTPDDMQLVRHGCLFRLPGAGTSGGLAVHVNNGRGMKGLFEQGLTSRFRAEFPQLTLAIDRHVDGAVLREAVAQNRVTRVRLVRAGAAAKWVAAGATARVALDVAVGGGGRIQPALIERYLGGDDSAFADIVDYAGLTFDQARVEVLLPDNARRLFDIAHPDLSRPLTRELAGIELDRDGEPTGESLFAELRAALTAAGM